MNTLSYTNEILNMNEGEMYDYDSEKEEFLPLDDNMEFV